MKKYEELALEIIDVNGADVITASVIVGDGDGTNPGPSPFAF